jgi:two-component system cell cycle response regulator DivK
MDRQTILVVEDNRMNRELAVDLLEAAGYPVLQAEDGMGLLERVRRERPNLILMDLQLPEVDGFTLVRQLKADPAVQEIPVLAVTAYARSEDRTRALAAGCDGYLAKPLTPRMLREAVRRLLPPDENAGEDERPSGAQAFLRGGQEGVWASAFS